jgi:hypothetical protein
VSRDHLRNQIASIDSIGHGQRKVAHGHHSGQHVPPAIRRRLQLKGRAERVREAGELERVAAAYREKYVDPGSGAQAALTNEDEVYRVTPRLVSAWSYSTAATRTEWEPE